MPYLTPDLDPFSVTAERVLSIPAQLAHVVGGMLHDGTIVDNWEKFGQMEPQECADAFQAALDGWYQGGGELIGEVRTFMRQALPAGFLALDGATYRVVDYPLLASVIPPFWLLPNDEFTLPDLRDRVTIGVGGTFSTEAGQTNASFQAWQVRLEERHLPNHSHYTQVPTSGAPVNAGAQFGVVTTQPQGPREAVGTFANDLLDVHPLYASVLYGIRYE